MEYEKDSHLEENHLLKNGHQHGYITQELGEPTKSGDASPEQTEETVQSTRRFRIPQYKCVEPSFFFFQLALWAIIPLRNQYLYSRLLQDQFTELGELTGRSYGHFDASIQKGRNLNSSSILPDDVNDTLQFPYTSSTDFWNQVKSDTSMWILYLELLASCTGLVTNTIICAYSDIGGRKIALALPTISLAGEAIIYICVSYYSLSISYLAIGHVLEGLCGTHLTLSGIAYAYLADITPEERRTLRFALLNAILLFCCMVGNVIVGLLISYVGYTDTFWFVASLCLLSFLYTVVFLQETVTNLDGRFSIREIFRTAVTAFSIYAVKREDVPKGRTQLVVLLFLIFLQGLILLGMIDLQTVYLVGPPLNFDSVKLGIFLAVSALGNAIGPVVAIGFCRKWVSDNAIAIFSCLLSAFGYFVYAFITNPNWIFAIPLVLCMIGVFAPLIRSMMSKIVSENEQGSLQASISAMNSLSAIGGPPLHLALFSATIGLFQGAVFIVISGLFLVMFALFVWLRRIVGKNV